MQLDLWTSLPAAFRAKTSALLANAKALTPNGRDYGLNSVVLLASYDRNSQSWRTSQTCLLAQLKNQADGLAEYWETWPRSGLMRSGIAYRLPLLAFPNTETACGLSPIPHNLVAKRYFIHSPSMLSAIK